MVSLSVQPADRRARPHHPLVRYGDDRKRAEERLRQSEANLRTIKDAIRRVIVVSKGVPFELGMRLFHAVASWLGRNGRLRMP
jgi:hypothetical protein